MQGIKAILNYPTSYPLSQKESGGFLNSQMGLTDAKLQLEDGNDTANAVIVQSSLNSEC